MQSRKRRWQMAAYAVCAVGLVTWAWWQVSVNPNNATYVTSVGEQKSILLPDGTLVTLDTGSRLRVLYSAGQREVRLPSGEARFTVATDPTRPLRVLTENSVIQANESEFNVNHRGADTTVTVVTGTVEVTQPRLKLSRIDAAEQAQVGGPGSGQRVRLIRGQRAHVGIETVPIH